MNKDKINLFVEKQNANRVKKSVYWKDKNLVSDKTYQSTISFLGTKAPSLEQVRTEKKILNEEINVFENRIGVYVSVKEKLKKV
jgi:hypothetical protein